MKSSTSLPEASETPSPTAIQLCALIRAEIAQSAAQSRSRATWSPRCTRPAGDYYRAGAIKFGEAGDFIAAPVLGSLFADGVARGQRAARASLAPDAAFIGLHAAARGAFAEDALKRLDEPDASARCVASSNPARICASASRSAS
ncbi:MAG: hypothetical protein H7A20_04915 [Rhodanobacteraceae bacterium]|nr:hypothetical protein [Rhodanobacteraceae bacterium]